MSGVQKISLEIFKGLDDGVYDKYILFSEEGTEANKELCRDLFNKAGAKVLFSKNLKREIGSSDFAALVEIYRVCKKEKFDIVHTNSTKPGIIGRIAATLAGVPVVVHTVHELAFHNFVGFPKWQFYWLCEMTASFFCDHIAMVSSYYSKYFGWFKKKCSVIHNGLDFTSFPPAKEKIPSDNVKVLFVGRLEFPKNPITMLKAAEIVLREYPNTLFTIVGDGAYEDECRGYVEKHNLENNIKILGWQENVFEYYRTHDIFAMTSLYESFGLIFLEAGFYGLPVAATNVEGVPEVVADGETGLLCSPKNPEALAENIMKLISDKEMRVRMGMAGRERVTTMFNSDKIVGRYSELYNKLYEKKSGKNNTDRT